MKNFIKKSIAVLLIITMVSGLFTCYATKYEKKYYDYGSYVLLGDSVASGWSDVEERETRFVRVEGSYGAHVADDLGVEYHPMACIGFRTVDMRYIFEDDEYMLLCSFYMHSNHIQDLLVNMLLQP